PGVAASFARLPIGWVLLLVLFFYVPVVGGYLYGVLGGAVYEFLKCRRLTKCASPISTLFPQRAPTLEEMMAEREWSRGSPDTTPEAGRQDDANGEPSDLPDFRADLETLGLKPESSWTEVQVAYRHMCKKYHPDTLRSQHLPPHLVELAIERFKR